jgi:hypothetical protein
VQVIGRRKRAYKAHLHVINSGAERKLRIIGGNIHDDATKKGRAISNSASVMLIVISSIS